MGGLADALLKAGLVSKETAAEVERERRKQERQQAEATLQRLAAPRAPQRGRDEAQEG